MTPRTIVASSLSLAGALRITRSAPASMCFWSAALLVKKPVDSSATWHLEGLPGQVGRVLLLGDLDLPAVDDQRLLAGLDRPLEPAVDAVVLQEQGQVLGVRKVVDRDDFELLGSCRHDAEDQAANPAEPVDPHSNRHSRLLNLREEGKNLWWKLDALRRSAQGRSPCRTLALAQTIAADFTEGEL